MTFIKPTTLLVGALCLAETAAEENVKFNENFKSLYATPSLGHPHGLYTETAFTKVNNYEPFRDASECKKSCEDSIVKSAGTSATFGGYFVCEFKLK